MDIPASPVERVSEDLAGLMPSFMECSRHDLEAMRAALAKGDFTTLARLGHSARGAGSNYGMLGLSRLGQQLENAAKDSDNATLASLLDSVSQYLDSVRIEFVPE